jgi:AcrR family transcriptional regulator
VLDGGGPVSCPQLTNQPVGFILPAMSSSIAAPARARQQQRAVQTRRQILETAARAFARHGHDGISLNQIIRESGLTKGAFYFHFPSREALALATFRHKQEQLVELIAARADDDLPALKRLAALLRERARLLEEDQSLLVVVRLGIELTLRYGPDSEYGPFSELPLAAFEALVREGQEAGEVRAKPDARATAETIFAGILGIDQAALMLSRGFDIRARTEQLLDVLIPGLRAERRRPPKKGRKEIP